MRRLLASLTAVLAAGFAAFANAQTSPACGSTYIASLGDALPDIAEKAYGDPLEWPRIYEYGDNAARLGADVTSLFVGTRIELPPCFSARDSAPTPPPVQGLASSEIYDPDVTRIEVLAASSPRLFVDPEAPESGLVPHLVKAAFASSGLKVDLTVTFVEDRLKGLDTLLWRNKFTFGMPWVKPDCRNALALPTELQILCDYEFSDPIYTASVVHYRSASTNWTPSSYLDLIGRNLCRPLVDNTLNIQEQGLLAGDVIKEFRPPEITDCFFQLKNGWSDFVAATRYEARDALTLGDLNQHALLMPSLVSARPVHLIMPKHSPDRFFDWMRAFNQGLAQIKQNGLYDEIVNWHLLALERNRQALR